MGVEPAVVYQGNFDSNRSERHNHARVSHELKWNLRM